MSADKSGHVGWGETSVRPAVYKTLLIPFPINKIKDMTRQNSEKRGRISTNPQSDADATSQSEHSEEAGVRGPSADREPWCHPARTLGKNPLVSHLIIMLVQAIDVHFA